MQQELHQALTENGLQVRLNVMMSDMTTFRLGGPCPMLVDVDTADRLIAAVRTFNCYDEPFMLMGGGSNLLVSDRGIACGVIRYVSAEPEVTVSGLDVHVSGATAFDDLARICGDAGLSGVVSASGIPGTVGGAIVGNAGAFGWQIADSLISVRTIDCEGTVRTETPIEIGFSYRHSGLKGAKRYVIDAHLRLEQEDPEAMRHKREEILELRHSKHPDLDSEPCAGSFFRNIEPTSKAERRQAAGHFLEQAGAKSFRVGGARVYAKHANMIIKSSTTCRSQDVYELSKMMQRAVAEHHGLNLVREVQLVGEFS